MSQPDEGSPIPLPEDLDRALRRATGRARSALTSLRKAVLLHVESERARGVALSEVKVQLEETISQLQAAAGGKKGDGDVQQELAAQVIKWTDGFYKRGD